MIYVPCMVVPLNLFYNIVYKCILSVIVPYIGTIVFSGGQTVNPRDSVESRNVISFFITEINSLLRFWETEEFGLRDSETVL